MPSGIVSINTSQEKMAEKNYQPAGIVLANEIKHYDDTQEHWVVSKKELLSRLQSQKGIGIKKAKAILQTFIDLEVLSEIEGEKDTLILIPVDKPYLPLDWDTAIFCLDHLQYYDFKVYCWLCRKWDIHCSGGFRENYFFSREEILRETGYKNSAGNGTYTEKITTTLALLYELNLIEYPTEPGTNIPVMVGRSGHHGKYIELLRVNRYSNVQKTVVQTHLLYGEDINTDNEKLIQEAVQELKSLPEETVRKIQVDPHDHW